MPGTGSFGKSMESMESELRAQRQKTATEERLKSPQGAADDTPAEPTLADKIDKYLPEKVYSSSRQSEYSYAEFKNLYSEVWDSVASKDHLMKGSVSITLPLGGSDVTVRSLSAREAQGLAKWENDAVGGQSGEQREFFLRRLVVQVESIGGQVFNRSIKLTPTNAEEWSEDAMVKQAYEFFAEKDMALILLIIDMIGDLDLAKQLALTENLKRP